MEQIIYWFDGVFDADLHTKATLANYSEYYESDREYYDIEKIERYAKIQDDLEKSRAEALDTIIGVLRKQDELNHAL